MDVVDTVTIHVLFLFAILLGIVLWRFRGTPAPGAGTVIGALELTRSITAQPI